jgi:hypothetical protein
MLRAMLTFITATTVSLSAATAARAAPAPILAPQPYVIPLYPAVGAACDSAARSIAASFATLTGYTVTRAACTAVSEYYSNIRITYQAAAALIPVSTYTWSGQSFGILPPSYGRYDYYEQCAAGLRDAMTTFQRWTQLTPVVAYCYYDSMAVISPWVPRVESFGEPTYRPYRADAHFFAYPPAGGTLEASLARLFANSGAGGVDVQLSHIATEQAVTVTYYARAPINLQKITLASLDTPEACSYEAAQLQSALQLTPGVALTGFCGRTFSLDWQLTGFVLGRYDELAVAAVDQFVSYGECNRERADVMTRFAGTASGRIIGGLCSRAELAMAGEQDWVVNLLLWDPAR